MSINTRTDIQQAYSDTSLSEKYIAERFDSAIGRVLHEEQVRFVADVIKKYQVNEVLEIAPGPARLTVDIGRRCPLVNGAIVDVNDNMLDEARRRLDSAGQGQRWQVVTGDAFDLPFAERFQLVYSFRFIRHFLEEDRARIYRQIYDHLDTNGLLIFDAINRTVSEPLRSNGLPGEYPIYDELYDFDQLKAELEKSRFRIIDSASVQRSYSLLSKIQVLIGPRSQSLAYRLMKMVEAARMGEPLEWIILCQKL